MVWVDIIGYSGSILIAASIAMNNIWKLRWINLFGAGTFAIYGLLVKAYPVFLLNFFITVIDVYYLVKMSHTRDFFTLAEVPEGSYMFLNKFLEYYKDDIQRFFPDFEPGNLRKLRCIFILRNLIPVGLFIFKPHRDGIAEIHLDYVRPDYRDLKNARFLYSAQKEYLKTKGIRTFITTSNVKAHQKYLLKLGFEADPEDKGFFHKRI